LFNIGIVSLRKVGEKLYHGIFFATRGRHIMNSQYEDNDVTDDGFLAFEPRVPYNT
jgi:hypothetical protein